VTVVLVLVIALLALSNVNLATRRYRIPEAIFSLLLLYPYMALAMR
jgi:hypothetical protein